MYEQPEDLQPAAVNQPDLAQDAKPETQPLELEDGDPSTVPSEVEAGPKKRGRQSQKSKKAEDTVKEPEPESEAPAVPKKRGRQANKAEKAEGPGGDKDSVKEPDSEAVPKKRGQQTKKSEAPVLYKVKVKDPSSKADAAPRKRGRAPTKKVEKVEAAEEAEEAAACGDEDKAKEPEPKKKRGRKAEQAVKAEVANEAEGAAASGDEGNAATSEDAEPSQPDKRGLRKLPAHLIPPASGETGNAEEEVGVRPKRERKPSSRMIEQDTGHGAWTGPRQRPPDAPTGRRKGRTPGSATKGGDIDSSQLVGGPPAGAGASSDFYKAQVSVQLYVAPPAPLQQYPQDIA
jgi:hypothetical protein